MNILAIGAHPDDIEYSVGGTLLKYAKQGHKIFIALTTSGNTGSNVMTNPDEIGRTREAEMLEAAKTYGAELRFLRNNDERLMDTDETRSQVLDAMRWANPDVIFTHNHTDESPDHAMTSKLVRNMMLSLPGRNQRASLPPIEKKPTLFLWENGLGVDFVPEIYIDITDEFDAKYAALQNHVSQKAWMDVFGSELGEDMKIMAMFRGMQYGCKYAECFRAFKIHGYMPNYKLLP
ncbi:MAG: PIG-L family deacetylase [Ruminococcaceae bacterium]|nr:PIG-L family deacetylase [Oscillospiraceae bacterium]